MDEVQAVEQAGAPVYDEPPRKQQRTSRLSSRGVSAAIAAERSQGFELEDGDGADDEDGEAGVSVARLFPTPTQSIFRLPRAPE